jgi:peptidoglycan hydrolase CwlO-like protein
MCKKLLVAAAAILIGVTAIRGNWGHRVSDWFHKATAKYAKPESPEKQIEKLKVEVSKLTKCEDKYQDQMLDESVAIDRQKKKIADVKDNLANLDKKLAKMRADLKTNAEFITYGPNKYTRDQVRAQFDEDWASYKACEQKLKEMQEDVDRSEKNLEMARKELTALQKLRKEMENELEQLKAELRAVRLAQAQSKFQQDGTEHARVKQSIEALRDRIAKEKKKIELKGEQVGPKVKVVIEEPKKVDTLTEFDTRHTTKTEVKVVVDKE